MDREKHNAKKRMMFVAGEDFYFLTYTLLIALDSLGAKDKHLILKDYRKLAFLSEVMSSPLLARLVESNEKTVVLADSDRRLLFSSYERSVSRIPLLFRLLYALEKQSIVGVVTDAHIVSVFLGTSDAAVELARDQGFASERRRMAAIRSRLPRLRTSQLPSLLSELFNKYGVRTWLD